MSGTKRAKDSELGKEIGAQIGKSLLMLVGLAVAAWLMKWQYGNILEGVYVPILAPIIGSVVLVGIAAAMITHSPNQLLSAVTCFGFSAGSIFLLYACFTHDATPWETLGAIWLGGAGWGCIFQPTLNDRFFLRLVATVSMLATYVVFFRAWLLLIPNIITGWQADVGDGGLANIFGAVVYAAIKVVALGVGGVVIFFWLRFFSMFVVCYLHTGLGPRIKVGNRSYRVPRTMRWAYTAAQTYDYLEGKRTGKVYESVLYTRCADLAYEEFQNRSKVERDSGKYFIAEKQPLDCFKVALFFEAASSLYAKKGDISRARDYAEMRLEIFKNGYVSRSAYDLCQAMESRQKYQDGRKVDPAAEAKLMAQWEEWKKEEAQDHAEYERELREEKLRRQAMHEESLREVAAQRYEDDDDDEEEYTWNGSSRGSASQDSSSQDSSSSDPWAEHKAEHDLGRIPNIIYDSSNNPWHKSWGSPDHVTYHNDQGQEVTIYSGQVSGSSAQTSAGHFHWY